MDAKAISQVLLAVTFLAAFGVAAFVVLASQINTASGRRGEARCPSCGVRDARASSTRTLRDYLFALFSCEPFRCRMCGSRFYWSAEREHSLKNAA